MLDEHGVALRCYRGKSDLLRKLPARLNGYSHWIPDNYRIIVLIDRDDDDCRALKANLENIASSNGLITRTEAQDGIWNVVNRIAIEELESWYFGDWDAVCVSYPRVPATVPERAGYRNPDAIEGGTWETFERILQRARYYMAGLQKLEAARLVGGAADPERNNSRSFQIFSEVFRREAFNHMDTSEPQ